MTSKTPRRSKIGTYHIVVFCVVISSPFAGIMLLQGQGVAFAVLVWLSLALLNCAGFFCMLRWFAWLAKRSERRE